MRRSKEPFNKDLFYECIEKEDWFTLWVFIDGNHAVNITEEDLRIAFAVLPKKYHFRNMDNWSNRFHPDFFREFADRFDYNAFECVRSHYKCSKLVEEYQCYWNDNPRDQLSCNAFTDVLRYKYNLNYIKRFINRLQYYKIFNWWGQRQKFHLADEEIAYLKEHVYETPWSHI